MEPKDPKPTENPPDLAYVLGELESIRTALALVGLQQCHCCRKYFPCPDGKSLLKTEQLVCFGCLEGWWRERSPQISIEERRVIERQILRWLVAYYGAKVIGQARQLPSPDATALKMIVGCEQCGGTGKRTIARVETAMVAEVSGWLS